MHSPRSRKQTAVAGAVVFAVGFLLASFELLYPALEHGVTRGWLFGSFWPTLLWAGVAVGGAALATSDLPSRQLAAILGWWGVGIGVTALLGVTTVVYLGNRGITLPMTNWLLIVSDHVAAGAFGGLLVGYYDSRRVAHATALAAERTELADEREKLQVLNRFLRHDIRNDLSIVKGNATLLEEFVPEDGKRYLDRIQHTTEDAIGLTKTAQAFIEALDGDRSLGPTPLGDVLETQVAHLREAYPEATVSAPEHFPPVAVVADDLLGSVFRNLLVNAVAHTPGDDPQVGLSVGVDDDVRVRVTDGGPGFPADVKESVFEGGSPDPDDSTGVGLFLVEKLVDDYGGELRVFDDQSGSTVEVLFPRADAALPGEDTAPSDGEAGRQRETLAA